MVRSLLLQKVQGAVDALLAAGTLPLGDYPAVEITDTKQPEHGDLATNFALMSSKIAGKNPREIATALAEHLTADEMFAKVEVAGPGFLNFTFAPDQIMPLVQVINTRGTGYAKAEKTTGETINVEFVSVNPNGPITIGSGRGAAFGDTLCRVLAAAGNRVHREYYINDGVNSEQMRLFAESVRHYLREAAGTPSTMPEDGYKGDYVQEVAAKLAEGGTELLEDEAGRLELELHELAQGRMKFQRLLLESPDNVGLKQDFEAIEGSIQARQPVATELRQALTRGEVGAAALAELPVGVLQTLAQRLMIERQKADLEAFGVKFDEWFSEQLLHDAGFVKRCLQELEAAGNAYRKDGALWLASEKYGDDKDRVIVRDDGRPTYIAADVAYHKSKFDRGATRCIDILGPDHHGYIGRLKASVQCMGIEPDRLEVIIFQIVRFLKDGKPAPMRKRDGNIYALRDLCQEVGTDVVRFFYLMRSHDTHFDFDIDLAQKQSDENPVFYVQYAHARICSILRKAEEAGIGGDRPDFSLLTHPKEKALLLKIADLPHEVERCAADHGVHRLTTYAQELARLYHAFYDACRVIQPEEPALSGARLALCRAAATGLKATLDLIGISAPESM